MIKVEIKEVIGSKTGSGIYFVKYYGEGWGMTTRENILGYGEK